VFVPGNPGVASFYASTAQALADKLGARAAVVGYRGHSVAPLLPPTAAFGLAEQVEHITSFIEAELATGDEVVVIGHSIGAWIALEAVRRAETLRRVAAFIGLMPYLQTETEQARKVSALITQWWARPLFWLIAAFGQLIGWLPTARWRRAGMELLEPDLRNYEAEQAAVAVACMLRFGTLYNVLTLFRAEAFSHATPYDYTRWEGLCDKRAAFLFAGDFDQWAPPEAAARAAAAGLSVHTEPGVPHAFGTRAATRAAVVAWIAQAVPKLRARRG